MFSLAACAYLLDHCLGELPCTHPVVLMGRYISGYESRFYRNTIFSGALLVVSLLLLTALISLTLDWLCGQLPIWLGFPLLALMASTGLAMQMLHTSVAALLTSSDPKQALRYLVSRDVEPMSSHEVYQAGIETWAENLSDGVIAPLCYLLLFGLPGLAVYKAINTLDSMVGYKTPRYFYFGKVAARLDDVANYLPARLTALLLLIIAKHKRRTWQALWHDGHKLDSPNAGYPIAAMAGLLGVALGVGAWYHGKFKAKPILGQALQPISKGSLTAALALRPALDAVILSLLAAGSVYFA